MKKSDVEEIKSRVVSGFSLDGELTAIICEHLGISVDFSQPPDMWTHREIEIDDIFKEIGV